MNRYGKNEKPFVYAVFSDHDKDQAMSILRTMEGEGVAFYFSERFAKREMRRLEAAASAWNPLPSVQGWNCS